MRMFFAFSTGAMMGRVLAKLLRKRNVDVTNRSEMERIMSRNPEELATAQRLVSENGEIARIISDELLKGVDASYRTQFLNWAWVALADDKPFCKYIGKVDGDGRITTDTHNTTDFLDHVQDFCEHMKKHSDFRQRCRGILNRISAKAGRMDVAEFMSEVDKMDKEWDSKRTYVVNDETIAEAWGNIERHEIHVDGSWGELKAYEIPSWADLMQTCHQTEWCVANKGNSGLKAYKRYGAPYYLICNGRRNPFALLNPNSNQFKDVRDYPIKMREDGSVMPTHRRAIMFGKAVLDKVAPNAELIGDLSCFEKTDLLRRLENEDRNDHADYDAMVDSMKENGLKEDDSFLSLLQSDLKEGDMIDGKSRKVYESMDAHSRDKTVDSVIASRYHTVTQYMVDDLCERNDTSRLSRLLKDDYDIAMNRHWGGDVENLRKVFRRDFISDYNYMHCEFITKLKNADPIVELMWGLTDGMDTDAILGYAMKHDNCSKSLAESLAGKVGDLSKADMDILHTLAIGIKNGRLGRGYEKAVMDAIAVWCGQHDVSGARISNDKELRNTILDAMSFSACTENFRNFMRDTCCRLTQSFWGPIVTCDNSSEDSVSNRAIQTSDGEVLADVVNNMEMQGLSVQKLLDNYTKQKYSSAEFASALMNPRCPDSLVEKALATVEYGKDCSVAKLKPFNMFSALFSSGRLNDEQFGRILKANPRLVVKYGWNSRHCTDDVKLALIRKIAKSNGQLFSFSDNENPEIVKEFYRTRLSAGKYGEYIEAVQTLPADMLEYALRAIINVRNPKWDEAVRKTCLQKNLPHEAMELLFEPSYIANSSYARQQVMSRNDVPDDIVEKAIAIGDLWALREYVEKHDNPRMIKEIADKFMDSDKPLAEQLRQQLVKHKACPDEYVAKAYEEACDESHAKTLHNTYNGELVANVIRKGIVPVKRICHDMSDNQDSLGYMDNDMIAKAVFESPYSTDDKRELIESLQLVALSSAYLERAAREFAGKTLFGRIVRLLDHDNDNVGYALAMNEGYTQEQIASIINRNTGVTEGYFERFGVDANVLKSKHLYNLIDDRYTEFTKDDIKAVLHCGNEDAAWLMKKYVRESMQHDDKRTASISRIASRIAMRMHALDNMVCDIARDSYFHKAD